MYPQEDRMYWGGGSNALARLMERTGEVGGLFVWLDEFDLVKISMIWDVSNESRLGRSIRTKFSISMTRRTQLRLTFRSAVRGVRLRDCLSRTHSW